MHDPTVAASIRTLDKYLNGNARLSPLARIVDKVPNHLFEVLTLTAKARVVLDIQIESDRAVAMNLLHRAHERRDDRSYVRDGTHDRYPGGKPGALQVPRHLVAH